MVKVNPTLRETNETEPNAAGVPYVTHIDTILRDASVQGLVMSLTVSASLPDLFLAKPRSSIPLYFGATGC